MSLQKTHVAVVPVGVVSDGCGPRLQYGLRRVSGKTVVGDPILTAQSRDEAWEQARAEDRRLRKHGKMYHFHQVKE